MQGASVKQTRSVCSERARTPAGGRSRCGFAKQIRGFSAQTISPIWMRCLSNLSRPCPASTQAPNRGESNSMQGASVKQTRSVCSERARTPAGGRSRCGLRSKYADSPRKASTRYGCDVIESQPAMRRINADRDALSRRQLILWGWLDRPAPSSPKPMRSPSQNWVEEGQNATAGGQHDCRR